MNPQTRQDELSPTTVTIASTIGATIEWYDFFLYGVVTPIVLNKLFFPSHDPAVGVALAYATFAIGFIARPVGGLIFGHYGDRIGRKGMLVVTILIMGLSTFAIGFVPTYESIGFWAPAMLITLRILQGIGLGGEWGGAVLMVVEHAPPARRGYFGAWPQAGAPAGLILSAGVVALLTLMPEASFLHWGWRIAFWLSAILIVIGIYIRLKIFETPEFVNAHANHEIVKLPAVELLSREPKHVLLGMGARYIEGAWFNLFGVFMISYLTNNLHQPRASALNSVIIASFLMIIFMPIFGHLSDKIGRRAVYGWGSIVLGIAIFPAFWLMNFGSSAAMVTIAVSLGILYAAVLGTEASLFSEQFSTEIRYSGISLVYQVSGIFASGLTPLIASALIIYNGGQPWVLCAYVVLVSLISAVSVYFMREGSMVSRVTRTIADGRLPDRR
jgi:MFS family permease